jgi:hypothetical protein
VQLLLYSALMQPLVVQPFLFSDLLTTAPAIGVVNSIMETP